MKTTIVFLMIFFPFFNTAFGQLNYTINSDFSNKNNLKEKTSKSQSYDIKLLKYYTIEQLEEIKNIDPEKFEGIKYFYLRSYTHTPFDCEECDFKKFMETFDISQYENLRHKSEPVVLDYLKTNYQVTLIPLNQLEHLTALQKYRLEN